MSFFKTEVSTLCRMLRLQDLKIGVQLFSRGLFREARADSRVSRAVGCSTWRGDRDEVAQDECEGDQAGAWFLDLLCSDSTYNSIMSQLFGMIPAQRPAAQSSGQHVLDNIYPQTA